MKTHLLLYLKHGGIYSHLRDGGASYRDYSEQLTYLIFSKIVITA